MPPLPIPIDGEALHLEDLEAVAVHGAQVTLAPAARAKVLSSRALVESVADGQRPAYGINTGFGTLAEVRIARSDLLNLQKNLVRSHAVGVGPPLSEHEARALLLLRANVLAKGLSGVRPEVIDLALAMLNHGVAPIVPERGSVGASGDLAPLAHLALALIGEGEVTHQGTRLPALEGLRRAGLSPLELQAKEGLALVNGTQAMAAVGGLALIEAQRLAAVADVAGAMTLEGLLGSHRPFAERIHLSRPQRGQLASARWLREILMDSELVKTHEHCSKVQDPYSLRCMPQVHGAARDGIDFARGVLATELNSATDNPLVFVSDGEADGEIVSGGNFHGQPVALALDVLAIALTQLATISERRVEQLVNPALSGLPPFLAKDPGLHSGFMMAQVTSAALVAESRILSHPASVDSIPSSAGREDHVSMGMTAALKARQVVSHARTCLAIELLVAAQALELRRPVRPGRGVEAAYQAVRAHIPPLDGDRQLHHDIQAATRLISSDELLSRVRAAAEA